MPKITHDVNIELSDEAQRTLAEIKAVVDDVARSVRVMRAEIDAATASVRALASEVDVALSRADLLRAVQDLVDDSDRVDDSEEG